MSEFEDLADEARASSGPASRRSCGVGDLLQSLAGEDAEHVEAALNDRLVSANALFVALKRRIGNAAPSPYIIQRHRRKSCSCWGGGDVLRGAELK